MTTVLALDIGNTHIHVGLFIKHQLRQSWALASDRARTVDEYRLLMRGLVGDAILPTGAIIGSVVPRLEEKLARAVAAEFNVEPLIVDGQTPLGILNGYAHPNEVGADRLANAVGAHYFFGAPIMVLDFGTAITLDYLAPPRPRAALPVYEGGAILPGIEMAADALAQGTARLPRVPLAEPGRVIGRTTAESIQSGLLHGYLGAISTLVERAREEIGLAVRVVATGGDALNLQRHLPFLYAVEPNLTLYGLRQIYGVNRDCPLPARE